MIDLENFEAIMDSVLFFSFNFIESCYQMYAFY